MDYMSPRKCVGRASHSIAPLLVGALLLGGGLSACGGDSSSSKAAATATATQSSAASDQAYAATVCTAFNKYLASAVAQAIQDPSVLSDPTKLAKVGGPALTTFADDMTKVTPPVGLETYHTALIASVRTLVDRLNNGQVRSAQDLADIGRQIQPDAATQARLTAAAKPISDCNSVPFFGAGGFANSTRTPRRPEPSETPGTTSP
jgi:hypothetical protein